MSPVDPPAPPDSNTRLNAGEDHAVPVVEEPEYESIDAFAEYLVDDDRTTYRAAELVVLARRTKLPREAVASALADYGFTQAGRSPY